MNRIDHFLQASLSKNSSDLHFISGDPPRVRIHGALTLLNNETLTIDFVKEALYEIMSGTMQRDFEKHDAVDFAYEIPDVSRFRVNVMRHLNGIGAVMRAIPSKALTLDELDMPLAVHDLCKHTQGMILVTGKTGSGKSTTLAAMVDAINIRLKGHILTIEDPIEFVHQRKSCLVSQREVNNHTKTFSQALHSALREDPDAILVGELRDLETMSLAVTAAETGILVLATLHTNSAAATVDRVINTFPVNKQPHIRTMLSTSLRAIVSQQLLKTTNGKGRVAAVEILINTSACSNILREGKSEQLQNIIQSGGQFGMQSMDSSLHNLVQEQKIHPKTAFEAANDKGQFTQYLKESS